MIVHYIIFSESFYKEVRMSQMKGGRTLSGVRIHPEDMDFLPSTSATRGTVTTIPADEINPVGSPREYGNARSSIKSISKDLGKVSTCT